MSHDAPFERRILAVAVAAYAALAAAMSWHMRELCNADFIAYVAIARAPWDHVVGYWSPLYSWSMAPLLWLGVEDRVAGRLVLVAAGFGYLFAVHALARRLAPERQPARRALFVVTHFVSVLQASLWATRMLAPDLLAATLVLAALAVSTGERAAGLRWGLAGVLFGLAYLAKAYMLPFALVAIALVLCLRRAWSPPGASVIRWRRDAALALLGLALVAGPWIAALSSQYGAFTISTSGAANHANVAPDVFGQDPLWRPPLEVGYVLDPRYGPDWSMFDSVRHLRQQAFLVASNLGKALEQLAGFVVFVLASWRWRRALVRRGEAPSLTRKERALVGLYVLAAVVYVAGYSPITLERRYHVSVVAPLLALAAWTLLWPCLSRSRIVVARPVAASLLLVCVVSFQEFRQLWVTYDRHPQSWDVRHPDAVGELLREAGWRGEAFAASDWHCGLAVAYLHDALDVYHGTPRAETPSQRAALLRGAGVRYFVRYPFGDGAAAAGTLDDGWQVVTSPAMERGAGSALAQILVDARAPAAEPSPGGGAGLGR